MSDFDDFFDGQNFENMMRSYCAQVGWQTGRLDRDGLGLSFDMPNGWRRALTVLRYGKVLEFCSPSVFHLYEGQSFREDLANLLLRQNTDLVFGFWCISAVGPGRIALALMHNLETQFLTVELFQTLVRYLVQTCNELDLSIENQVRPQGGMPPQVN